MLYSLLRPLLFRLDAETAHGIALCALKLMPRRALAASGPLATSVAGLTFPHPLGMAAGFDKDGEVPDALLGLGFGFAEVGSITPLPQAGNPRPRLFRLWEDRAVINRMGFNNGGGEVAARRLAARLGQPGVVGINIGANKDSADRIADYATMAARGEGPSAPPVFLKVAPDLLPADIDAIARIAIDKRLGGLIVSNTTISRPPLRSAHAGEAGGLSGAPLKALALATLRDFRKATGGAVPLVGVGGIATAEDAWERIRAGASLVQLYSAMVYEGPGIARAITRGLEALMRRDGFASIAEAVGSE